jgi:SAM-dependent methyltransferase
VDATEEDHLFEYLNLLVSRPEVRKTLGARAREWVETECTWPKVAERYAEFLEHVAHNGAAHFSSAIISGAPASPPAAVRVEPEYILSWAPDEAARGYIETHVSRFEKTLAITPPGGPEDRILEMGSYLQITPALKTRLGYGEVRGCYFGPAGKVDDHTVTSGDGEPFQCTLELFDAEKDRFPYDDGYFSTVLCCELVEHLTEDPMHMMSEINRILRPDGHLVLTTPNIGSLRAIAAILAGYHPGFFPAYIRPRVAGEEPEARHNREYTAREIVLLFHYAGFEMTLLETGPFRDEPKPEHEWVKHMIARYEMPADLRGDGIYAVGRKRGPVRERYPDWLYQ